MLGLDVGCGGLGISDLCRPSGVFFAWRHLIADRSSGLCGRQVQKELVVAQGVCQEFGKGAYAYYLDK